MGRRKKSALTSKKMAEIREDGILNIAEIARRAELSPPGLLMYCRPESRCRIERPSNSWQAERVRNVLRDHAIWLLKLTGDIPEPTVPDEEPMIPKHLKEGGSRSKNTRNWNMAETMPWGNES